MFFPKSPTSTWPEHLAFLREELQIPLYAAREADVHAMKAGHWSRVRSDIAQVESIIAAEEAERSARPTFDEALDRWIGELVAFHDSIDPDYAHKPVSTKGQK
jgi:hypothetical protein